MKQLSTVLVDKGHVGPAFPSRSTTAQRGSSFFREDAAASQLPRQIEGLPVFARERVAPRHMFFDHLVLPLEDHTFSFEC